MGFEANLGALVASGQVIWLNPEYAPRFLWDTHMGQDSSKGAEVRDVMAKAFKVSSQASSEVSRFVCRVMNRAINAGARVYCVVRPAEKCQVRISFG